MQRNTKLVEARAIALVDNERNYRQHVARLSQINESKAPQQSNRKSLDEHYMRLQRCEKDRQRKQALRSKEIQKDNDRLLNKLLKLNFQYEKKKVVVVAASSPVISKSPARSSSALFENGKVKSLNYVTRKNDIMKILDENMRITGRIAFKESILSKDKLDRDFEKNREYMSRIRKVKVNPDKTLAVGHGGVRLSKDLRMVSHSPYLPPLHTSSLTQLQSTPGTFRSSSVRKLHSLDLQSVGRVFNKGFSLTSTVREPRTSISVPEDYATRRMTRSQSNIGFGMKSPSPVRGGSGDKKFFEETKQVESRNVSQEIKKPEEEKKEEVEVPVQGGISNNTSNVNKSSEEIKNNEDKSGEEVKNNEEKQEELVAGVELKQNPSLIKEVNHTQEESKKGSYVENGENLGEESSKKIEEVENMKKSGEGALEKLEETENVEKSDEEGLKKLEEAV